MESFMLVKSDTASFAGSAMRRWLLSLLLLCAPFMVSYAEAGGGPAATILDILSDAQGENIEKISVLADAAVDYSIDETDLNNTQNPQLLIEIQNASLDQSLGNGLGTSVTVKRNGVLRVEAVESPQTRRVYLYVELAAPRSYRELSKAPAKRIDLEILPASGKAGRALTPAQNQQAGVQPGRRLITTAAKPGSTRPVSGSTPMPQDRVRIAAGESTGEGIPGTATPQSPSTQTADTASVAPAGASTVATPSPTAAGPTGKSRIAHVHNLIYKQVDKDKLRVTIELDQPVEPQIVQKEQGIQITLPHTLLALRTSSDGQWLGEQTLEVEQGAVKQIHIRQESIDPEQVVILIEQAYATLYQRLVSADPNQILLEVETEVRPVAQETEPGAVTTSVSYPQPRIEGNTIYLPIGQSITLDMTLEPVDTVMIGDPNIADVTPNNANSLIVNGRQRGLTNLEIRDRYNRLVANYAIQVYEDSSWLEQQIAAELGDTVKVRVHNSTVFLEGEVADSKQAQQAEALAQAMIGGQGNVQSSLTIHSESSEGVATRLQGLLASENLPDVAVEVQNSKMILTGKVSRYTDLQRAENLARFFSDSVTNSIDVQLPDTLAQNIQSEIGLSTVQVQFAEDSAILRGIVHTEAERTRVEQIAQLYVPRVTNLVEVQPAHPTAEEIQAFIGLTKVTARWSGDVLLLGGAADSQLEASMAEQIAKRFATSVVNNIKVTRQDQVNIKVRVIEINKNASSRLGIDWTNAARLQEEFIPRGRLQDLYKMGRAVRLDPITATINALLEEGSAKILVDTNLTTVSGKMAQMHSGGEFPLVSQITTGGQTSGTTFGQDVRAFGVQLQITPTVDEQEFITVDLQPEVSSINRSETVLTPMGTVPVFNSRKLEATVRVRSGETFAIGGVMQQEETFAKSRIPILGHIPLLGELFTSRRKSTVETELVFILTPTLVRPGMSNPSQGIPESPFPIKSSDSQSSTPASPQKPVVSNQEGEGTDPTAATPNIPSFEPSSRQPQPVAETQPFEW